MTDIDRYRIRRERRLQARFDGGFITFVFGWLRGNGVDTNGMSPDEAVQLFNEKRAEGVTGKVPDAKVSKPKQVKMKQFINAIKQTKGAVDKDKAWRVDIQSAESYAKDHPGSRFYATKDGSTVAIDQDGDIISVCNIGSGKGGVTRGKQLLDFAVKHGGKKLDSFSGNHQFYVKCGFEPVCRVPFADVEGIRPGDWDRKRDKKEDVVFYKYVGKGNVKAPLSYEEARANIPEFEDYDEAKAERDRRIR